MLDSSLPHAEQSPCNVRCSVTRLRKSRCGRDNGFSAKCFCCIRPCCWAEKARQPAERSSPALSWPRSSFPFGFFRRRRGFLGALAVTQEHED